MAALAVGLCSQTIAVQARPMAQAVAAPSYYQQASNSFQRGQYDRALDLLDRTPASAGLAPKTRADLLNLRGAIYLRQGRLDQARATLAEALTLDPQASEVRSNLAEVDSRRKKQGAERQRLRSASATMAMVQMMPAARKEPTAKAPRAALHQDPSAKRKPPAPSANPVTESQSTPPASVLAPAGDDETDDIAPALLARKRPGSKPAPKPSPAGEPAAAESSTAVAAPGASPAPSATPAPAATPSPDPASPAFLQKYEAAYVKYLEKDFAGAKAILNEADLIQKNQPASIDLRNKIFSYYYKIAYSRYTDKDYPGSQMALDDADAIQKDQPDSLNLRGLIFSRQRVFDQAEVMFKKAVAADPGFWAAKFNMAELPFTYRNYTVARSRYEQLLAETNAAKQPRESELTQFKVFLTLLLEGKESAARAFMDHFSFTGATPARYYCQAALDFYSGSTDKAAESIAEARKDFPPQIEAIFADSFYRVGWLTDPSKPGTVAAGSPPSPTPSPSLAAASPGPSPTATPTLMAAAAPTATPLPAPTSLATSTPAPTKAPTATPSPVATATPSPTTTKAPTVTATPSPTVTKAPTATATPAATATPTPAATTTPTPTATKAPTAIPTPTPTATKAPTVTPTPTPTATKAPTVTATPSPVATASPTPTKAPAIIVTPVPVLVPTATPPPSATPTVHATSTPKPTAAAPTVTSKPSVTSLPSASPSGGAKAVAPIRGPESSPAFSPSETPATTDNADKKEMSLDDLIRLFVFLMVPCYLIGSWIYILRRVAAYKAESRKPALHYGGRKRSRDDKEPPR